MRIFFTAFLVSALILSSPVKAEEPDSAPVIPKPLNVMPSKIKPVQSNKDELSRAAPEREISTAPDNLALEIFSPRPAYGFQSSFWDGLNRQAMVTFLSSQPITSKSRTIRNLALKVALTPSAGLPPTDKADENIYALRLKKLVGLGAFEDAQKLYKMNEGSPPTALAALSGIEASIGNGEMAVACLDQKTFDNGLKQHSIPFWTNIDAFCQALLSPVAGDDDTLRLSNASRAYIGITKQDPVTVDNINGFDAISTIALLETGKLTPILSSPENLLAVDDKHLGLMLTYAKPSLSNLPLIAEAIKRGMISNAKVIAFIKAADVSDITNPYPVFLKEYFKNPETPLLTDKLLELTTSPTLEWLLLPLVTANDVYFPEKNNAVILKAMARAGEPLPVKMAASVYAVNESAVVSGQTGEEIVIKNLLETSKLGDKTSSGLDDGTLLALDYANYPQKDVKNAYDNNLSLTPAGNYVMPNGDILSSLKKSAEKKQMNQVVIRSLAIINDEPLEKLHPVALYRILEALNSAGLNEETISLTREVLGNLMKK